MNRENIDERVVPVLHLPKQCTNLEINCEDFEEVFIEMSISMSSDLGHVLSVPAYIYEGFCEGFGIIYPEETVEVQQEYYSNSVLDWKEINQMPIILSDASICPEQPYSQSVWIDPSRSPYVYNHYESPPQDNCSVKENADYFTILNDDLPYIDQEVYYYEHHSQSEDLEENQEIPETQAYINSPEISNEEEDSESDIILSQLKNKTNKELEKNAKIQEDNDALKQLMSEDIQSTSRQRKTILFLGENSSSGQTIQNIRYMDPKIKCAPVVVDHEVVIEDTPSLTPKKKKYQCDECKQIFQKLAEFRKHINGSHTNYKIQKSKSDLSCPKCGKKFSNYFKYQQHSNAHGDPDLECHKCHKVYASKGSLKVHLKIHDRKFPCTHCTRSFETAEPYKKHLKKHSTFVCSNDGCFFVTNSIAKLVEHHDEHNGNYNVDSHKKNYVEEQVDVNDYFIGVNSDRSNLNNSHVEVNVDHVYVNDPMDTNDDHMEINNDHGKDYYYDSSKTYYNQGDDNNNHIEENNFVLEPNNIVITETDIDNLIEGWEKDLLPECDLITELSGESEKNNNVYVEMSDNTETQDTSKKNVTLRKATLVNKSKVKLRNKQKKKIKPANSVIAKVLSNKIFLADSKEAKKRGKNNCKSCVMCAKSFDRLGDLKRHLIEHIVKSTLTKVVSSAKGTLLITCEICQKKSFNAIDKYKEHLREHAKLTMYRCTLCDRSFSDSSNFSKHKKIHGDAYFQCDLCHRKFNTKAMLIKHIDLHNKNEPLKCKHCDRMFYFKSTLNKHVKSMHDKEKSSRYSCTFCSETLKALKDKWEHEWDVHHIRKMIADCKICNAKFRRFSDVKRHIIDEHNIEIPSRAKLLNDKRMQSVVCVEINI